MRVYVPMTVPVLSQLWDGEPYGAGVYVAYAVTPALREWYAESDTEELELAAFFDAERAALGRVAADLTAPRIRVVVAGDVPDDTVTAAAEEDDARSLVMVRGELVLADLVSVHLDEEAAEPDIAAAIDALVAAAQGDDDAQFTVDGAEGHDLLWYDASEIDQLLEDLISRYDRPGPEERPWPPR
jgi:uncharacterized protein DUF6912